MSDWRLSPGNAALVVVDIQEKLMNVMARRAEVIAGSRKILGAARVLQLPCLMTAQYTRGLGPVCPEVLETARGVAAIEKLSFSSCGAPEFMATVKGWRRKRLLVCGVEAHVCVQQTVIDLISRDYFVYVLADAVCSRRDLDCTTAIERMRDCGAVITTVESAIFELLREAGTEQFKQILPLVK